MVRHWVTDLSCPLCISNVQGRSNYRLHKGYHRSRPNAWRASAMVVRRVAAGEAANGDVLSDAAAIAAQGGADILADWLASSTWPDGAPRVRGTLLVFFEGGRWKVCLNDKAEGAVGFLSVPSLLDVVQDVNQALIEGRVDWRERRDPVRNGQKKP